jgi:hypothetical protein
MVECLPNMNEGMGSILQKKQNKAPHKASWNDKSKFLSIK